MLFAEHETDIIEWFQLLHPNEIYPLHQTREVTNILSSIMNRENWEKWKDSSAKNAPPPDFYCEELKLMMEVMRVDDHGIKRKGKVVNLTRAKEHQLEKELRDSGILTNFPDAKLFINADSGLPTEKDHNYRLYCDNFKRTLSHHIGHIPNYRKNHPNYKLIFFVFDESSMYFVPTNENTYIKNVTIAAPHYYFWDKAFTSVFQKADIDYLIWFTPYKYCETIGDKVNLPQACIYKVGENLPEEITYAADQMISCEL